MQVHSISLIPLRTQAWPNNTPTATQTKTMSDQSDIESRKKALKEELRKHKSMAHQLKKEQKKKHKEQLKAQETSLLKLLESYNDFIQKTKAELNNEQDTTPADKAKIKTLTAASGKTKIKPLPPHRSNSSECFKIVSDLERIRPDCTLVQDDFTPPRCSRSTSLLEGLSDENVPIVMPTPVYGSPEHPSSVLRGSVSPQCLSRPVSREDQPLTGQAKPQTQIIESGNESIVSNHRSDIQEELGTVVGNKSEDQHSACLFKLEKEERPSSGLKLSVTDHGPFSKSKECRHSPSGGLETDEQTKIIESSAAGEDGRSANSHSNSSNSVARETKTSEQHNDSSPYTEHSYTPDCIALSSKKGAPIEDAEASPPSTDDFYDDFESFMESSPREVQHSSKSTSPSLPSPREISEKSPVLGPSSQEELTKCLAELELNHELLDDLGDEQDWFDEDFGLSSCWEQQRLKQKQKEDEEEAKLGGGGGRSGSSITTALGGLVTAPGGEQQVKTPPRPEMPLPLPLKLPEQPAMVVPHSATEVEKLVHTATQEIWDSCKLGEEGALTLTQLPIPKPSQVYLEANSQDHDALCIGSYKQAVYDLTWEILQEIYAEDPNAHQPLWVKPQRANFYFHRVKSPRDIAKVQEFITAEVLKLYGLKKDQNQKTDWQKMLKFGRKKRDRVDDVLVQELHEEEAQWVNYDEDELFVKVQLANNIFDALLKDTADSLTQIYDKRAKRAALS